MSIAPETRPLFIVLIPFYLAVVTIYVFTLLIPEDGTTAEFITIEKGPEIAIDILKDTLDLGISLAAGILAGGAALVYHWAKYTRSVKWFEIVSICVVLISAAATFYGVLLTYNAISNFELAKAFVPSSHQLNWVLTITYHRLIVGGVALATAFISTFVPWTLSSGDPIDQDQNVPPA